ncbi:MULTISPECIES: 50S ribosomal protein L24 [Dehalobacter]|jgi:large subunit ribosomal protein L24|uniref:Large ribosomal subunit protein uL24 n=2 Tax=Dehalobacter restrictus TaxID=55583 RepID=A0A857DEG6_9FIRM|nr:MULTISPECIES: 50S ribosomal protein L24 [Dehalobacter]AFV02902.1 LSU ribosomal protein L24p (L26e) [Dehalobacter sp. DCA]AFV05889.1 LSU ribosomal protein L24p (L26e) [Dehalobacter sp. CF]AHF09115.1 50S ribosomal protein L24 [Dehalobacter restrictus DSM 9455]EQB22535.1 LSU ribosomal protein L24p (L26e) [Dehalobacter sp. UNSWDHB]MCG1024430.1 50S ribosomal protein L24 [Dehalobacter sp.]
MSAERTKVNVRKGDMVMVITGKDAGKKGKVLEVLTQKGRVVVEKVNVVKKHQKPTKDMPQGGIVDKEAPIHSSNVMLFCTECNSVTRKSVKITGEGKVRVCKNCGHNLPEENKK